ncbi:unnamed protein product [Arabidopsis halleri]
MRFVTVESCLKPGELVDGRISIGESSLLSLLSQSIFISDMLHLPIVRR